MTGTAPPAWAVLLVKEAKASNGKHDKATKELVVHAWNLEPGGTMRELVPLKAGAEQGCSAGIASQH